jgi:integrase
MTRHSQPKRWTASALANLPARPSPYTDPAETGHQLLVRKKGDGTLTRTFLHRFKWKGEEVRISTGIAFPHLAQSRAVVRQQREEANKGIDPRRGSPRRRDRISPLPLSSDAPEAKHTIEFLCSEFTTRFLRPHRKDPQYAEDILARDVLPEWKGRDARSIKPTEVIELTDKITERGSPVAANRTAALLGQLFRFGIHRRIVESSPVQLLYKPGGKEKARSRVLTDEELAAFVKDPKAATRYQRLASAMLVLLLTAARRGELARARWSDIDFAAKTWTVPDANSKTGVGYVVPLSDWALREFRTLQRMAKGSHWVLPANGGAKPADPKQLTRGVAKNQQRFLARGVKPFVLQDLRRTCRTNLSRLKVEPHIAERVLNHVQPGVAGVYDRFEYIDQKREALTRWAEHLRSLVGTASASSAK